MSKDPSLFEARRIRVLGPHNQLHPNKSQGETWHLEDERGRRIFAKRASDKVPFAVTNEWLCARMARDCGLRVPEHRIVPVDGVTYFGSVDAGLPTYKDLGHSVLRSAKFVDDLARVIVFDLWVMNRDRHEGNFLVGPKGALDGDERFAVVFDHDRALFAEKNSARGLRQRDMDEPAINHLHRRLSRLIQGQRLTFKPSVVDEQIERVSNVSDDAVYDAVQRIPAGLAEAEEREAVSSVLISRRDRLGAIVDEVRRSAVASGFV